MPFTVSHVAAVLPVHRPLARARLFGAAVIGSMTPDFGFFLPWTPDRSHTHSLEALVTFCLPMGLFIYWLTQLLFRPTLTEILPDRAYARLVAQPPARRIGELRSWLLVVPVILAGAVTHLVWDGFTHEGARGVRMIPALEEHGPELAGHSVYLYRWLQHGSSVVGLAVVLGALALWLHHAPRPRAPLPRRLGVRERRFWLGLCLAVPTLMFGLTLARGLAAGMPLLASSDLLEGVVVATMRASAEVLLAVSLLLRLRL